MTKTRYKLIIFDFDGTLADSYSWFAGRINEAARLFRFREIVPELEEEMLRRMDTHSILRHLQIPLWKLPLIAWYMRRQLSVETDRVTLFQGVDLLFRELHLANIKLAIVSSNSLENIRRILPPEISERIHHYECGSSIFGKKAKFLKVLSRFKLPKDDVLCVGDELRDIEAARAAGLASAAVTWGYADPEFLRSNSPTHLVDSVDELLNLIR